MGETKPYFGYGSNLDFDDWSKFCNKEGYDPRGMEEICAAYLPRHEMKFHYHSYGRGGGAADVVDVDTDSEVPGALFTLNEQAWEAMNLKEGFFPGKEKQNCYEPKPVRVRTEDGFVEAITYIVVEDMKKSRYVAPTPEYVALIRTGLERRNLPTTALDDALE